MKFRLVYDGKLKGGQSKDAAHIHEIRKEFHRQLGVLWMTEPLKSFVDGIADLGVMEVPSEFEVLASGGVKFLPIAQAKNHLLAELKILLLRPAPAGALLQHGGDIDNRIKTLIDALRVPTPGEVAKLKLQSQEEIFFCVLEDDKLVTSFAVEADTLLENGVDHQYCHAVIEVRLWASKVTMENLGLIS
ncbi:hypothetical protein [Parvibaculum sp.]|uniref:hypothetical protein n=1 Tax=Parvibaculum sp. TaxID=2024848 RepID=UPI0034A02D51